MGYQKDENFSKEKKKQMRKLKRAKRNPFASGTSKAPAGLNNAFHNLNLGPSGNQSAGAAAAPNKTKPRLSNSQYRRQRRRAEFEAGTALADALESMGIGHMLVPGEVAWAWYHLGPEARMSQEGLQMLRAVAYEEENDEEDDDDQYDQYDDDHEDEDDENGMAMGGIEDVVMVM